MIDVAGLTAEQLTLYARGIAGIDPGVKNSANEIELKEIVPSANGKAVFEVDEYDNVIIKIYNAKGEVIRRFPPEEYLKAVENMRNILDLEV